METRTAVALSIANSTIEHFLEHLWQGLAISNLAKMAPFYTALETMWTLNSFAQMSSMLSLKKNVINAEIDPASAPIDNLGYACLDTTAPQAKLYIKAVKNYPQMNKTMTQTNSRITKQSNSAQQLTLPTGAVYVDPIDEKLRITKKDRYSESLQLINTVMERYKERAKKKYKEYKALKDKRLLTSDYDGSFFAVNKVPVAADKLIRLRPVNGLNSVVQKKKETTLISTIENDKIKYRYIRKGAPRSYMELPKFLDPKLITDDFAASGRIAQGVRISEQAGPSEKIVRYNKREKALGLNAYGLDEFKNYTKDLHFKYFDRGSRKIRSVNSVHHSIATINAEEGESVARKSKGERGDIHMERYAVQSYTISVQQGKEQRILQSKPSRNLPFIHSKGFRKHDISSDSSLPIGLEHSRVDKKKSTIIIVDHNLYAKQFTAEAKQ